MVPPTKEEMAKGEGDQEVKLGVSYLLNNYVTFRVLRKSRITNDCMVLLFIEPSKRPEGRGAPVNFIYLVSNTCVCVKALYVCLS